MKTAKMILDFYIESSLHVALAVYALIRVTYLKLNIPYDDSVAYFGFFGTVVGYNFVKYDELARVKKVVLTPFFKAIITVSFLAALATFYYFLELKTKTKLVGFGTLILTLLYTLPFFPNQKNMRNWSGLKIYLVAIAWVGVTVILPVINAETSFSIVIVLKCMQRFIVVFVLLLIFEIIDLQFDDLKLHTIPQKIGVNKTKWLVYILVSFFVIMEFLKGNVTSKDFMVLILVAFCITISTFFANAKRTKYYTAFWVESIPVFWLLLLLLF